MQHTYKNPQLARGELFSKLMTIATPKMAQYVLDALTDKEVRIFLANFSQTVTMLKKNNVKSFDADQLIMMVQRLAEQFPFEFGNVMTPSFKTGQQGGADDNVSEDSESDDEGKIVRVPIPPLGGAPGSSAPAHFTTPRAGPQASVFGEVTSESTVLRQPSTIPARATYESTPIPALDPAFSTRVASGYSVAPTKLASHFEVTSMTPTAAQNPTEMQAQRNAGIIKEEVSVPKASPGQLQQSKVLAGRAAEEIAKRPWC